MRDRLESFLSQPGLILPVDSNCSVGREKRQGCIKECLKVENPHKTRNFLRFIYRKFGDFSLQAGRQSDLPNLWPC